MEPLSESWISPMLVLPYSHENQWSLRSGIVVRPRLCQPRSVHVSCYVSMQSPGCHAREDISTTWRDELSFRVSSATTLLLLTMRECAPWMVCRVTPRKNIPVSTRHRETSLPHTNSYRHLAKFTWPVAAKILCTTTRTIKCGGGGGTFKKSEKGEFSVAPV